MAYRSAIWPVASALGLLALGAAGLAAYRYGVWGTLLGVALVSLWIVALGAWRAVRQDRQPGAAEDAMPGDEAPAPYRLVLDQVPVPLVDVRGEQACALNRSARALFGTDDRILPPPPALIDAGMHHLLHQGRRFRIDRIAMDGHAVAALIDVEAEERTAEARATAEMIQVLGHEMLNGLAPIVSLAESGLAAITAPVRRDDLLPEILGTLGRRAEGLLRFSEAYRSMARLPEPVRRPVVLKTITEDLARLFAGRWGGAVALEVDVRGEPTAAIDGDQITQALWALLQNGAEAATSGTACPRVSLFVTCNADRLLIDVSDSGDGIAPEDAVRIFRPFHTTKADGTGIGLSLARQIALAHGGEILLGQTKPTIFRIAIECKTA